MTEFQKKLESANPEELIRWAKAFEAADRYDDMTTVMSQCTKLSSEPSIDERNLLSVAYKNAVGQRRTSIRQVEDRSKKSEETHFVLDMVKAELKVLCDQLLDLVDNYLLKSAKALESQVFYSKMKGDYYRYLAETFKGSDAKVKSLESYQAATDAAAALPPTHPIRLGLALNFSVFYYEILGKKDEATNHATAAFDAALPCLQDGEGDVKDSSLIMQLLKDNITLWKNDEADDNAEADD